MTTSPPAGIAEADWQTWPAGARTAILALQKEILTLRKENEELLARFAAVATELSTLRERQGRRSAANLIDWPGLQHTSRPIRQAFKACPAVIQRKISTGVPSRQGATCRSRLLTVPTSLRQQGRDVWPFLEQVWMAAGTIPAGAGRRVAGRTELSMACQFPDWNKPPPAGACG